MSLGEVLSRLTITGAIEIGRHHGAAQVTFPGPLAYLERAGLVPFVRERYGEG